MFRRSFRLLQQATRSSTLTRAKNIALIQKATKDVESATNELRWLSEHVRQQYPSSSQHEKEVKLAKLCEERSQHVPLQYIIGSQPFGSLEIKCRPGVLIPRPETEAYTMYLSRILRSAVIKMSSKYKTTRQKLHILDLCSGSGCISLLLYETLRKHYDDLHVNGWDISEVAINNANENIKHNKGLRTLDAGVNDHVIFHQGDIFGSLDEDGKLSEQLSTADVIISNPPYVSEHQFWTETEESVRRYEPKTALVPDLNIAKRIVDKAEDKTRIVKPEDVFYDQMVSYFTRLPDCMMLVMEIGDDEQAIRVARMMLDQNMSMGRSLLRVEIWRDWPEQEDAENEVKSVEIEGTAVKIAGAGKMRSVIVFQGDGLTV